MIDEKINNSLKELEQGLKNVESARKQVEKTVSSYDGLNKTTAEYVSQLGVITAKIGKDYDQKVKAFEKDRDTVIKASNAATEKLSNATEEFKDSLLEIQTKLKYSMFVNAVSLVAIAAIVFLILK